MAGRRNWWEGEGVCSDPVHWLVVVAGAAPADQRSDPALAEQVAVLVMVVAAVSHHDIGLAAWPASVAADRWYRCLTAGPVG